MVIQQRRLVEGRGIDSFADRKKRAFDKREKDGQRENPENFCPFRRKYVTKDVDNDTPHPTHVWMRRDVQGQKRLLITS